MPFQLVLATDDEITVWHTEYGHIYQFVIDPPRNDVVFHWTRDVPDAECRADTLQDEARRFAAGEARMRRLIA